MRFIDDEGVIGFKLGVTLRLCQQDAISHELDRGCLTALICKADLIAHILANR